MTNLVEAWIDNWYGVVGSITPAFKQHSMALFLSYANLFNQAWNLDLPAQINTNYVTEIRASPRFHGVTGGIVVGDRYAWSFAETRLESFADRHFYSGSLKVKEDFEKLSTKTNLLNTNSAIALGREGLLSLAIPTTILERKEPQVSQLTGLDDKVLLPLYFVDWGNIRMEISGVSSNIVFFFNVSAALPTLPPTNYFEIIGATNEATRTPQTRLRKEDRAKNPT